MNTVPSPNSEPPRTSSTLRPATVTGVTPSVGAGPIRLAPRRRSGSSAAESSTSSKPLNCPWHSVSTPILTGSPPAPQPVAAITTSTAIAGTRTPLVVIGRHPHSAGADRDLPRRAVNGHRLDDFATLGIDTADRVIERACHPHSAEPGSNAAGAVRHADRGGQTAGGRINPANDVVDRPGDPDAPFADSNRAGREWKARDAADPAAERVDSEDPSVSGVADDP